MSEDEVREEFSKFLEQHHDGKIHKREFKKMLEQVFFFTRVHNSRIPQYYE